VNGNNDHICRELDLKPSLKKTKESKEITENRKEKSHEKKKTLGWVGSRRVDRGRFSGLPDPGGKIPRGRD